MLSASHGTSTLACFFLLLASVATAEDFSGRVVRIIDGDSIVVLHNEQQIDVRLEGIDCPESGQAFGSRAKQATSGLAFGKMVTVKATGKDRFGRTLARVILPDETELNSELVRRGFAWWFRRYSDDESLQELEAEAREAKRGLWRDPKAVAPWDWRAAQRAQTDLPPTEIEVVPNGVQIVALLPNPKGVDAGNEQVTIGNSTTAPVDLAGWKLVDKAGNVYLPKGVVMPGEPLTITMTEPTMPLNNDGDAVLLMDPDGVGRSQLSYGKGQVRAGVPVRFGSAN